MGEAGKYEPCPCVFASTFVLKLGAGELGIDGGGEYGSDNDVGGEDGAALELELELTKERRTLRGGWEVVASPSHNAVTQPVISSSESSWCPPSAVVTQILCPGRGHAHFSPSTFAKWIIWRVAKPCSSSPGSFSYLLYSPTRPASRPLALLTTDSTLPVLIASASTGSTRVSMEDVSLAYVVGI